MLVCVVTSLEMKWNTVYRWIKELYLKAWRRPLLDKDVYQTLEIHESKHLSDRFSRLWEMELRKQRPSLTRVICKMYAFHVMWTSIFFTFVDTLSKYVNSYRIRQSSRIEINLLYETIHLPGYCVQYISV